MKVIDKMKWHDCKTDPPKKEGQYLVYVQDYDYDFGSRYGICFWFRSGYGSYFIRLGGKRPESKLMKQPIKWAEINLEEDD